MAAQHRASAAGAPPGLALAGPVMAADWYVSPSGLDTNACTSTAAPCKTIQAAIDKAAAYDTVHVGAGSYSFEAQRIRIEKEGLRLIGDNSPFGVDPIAHPGPNSKAANASVLAAPTQSAAEQGGITVNAMIWVRNVRNVRIENLYIELAGSRSKEAIVATGAVNGLEVIDNYVKTMSGSGMIAIGVNVTDTSDSSVPESEARVAGQFVTIQGNLVEPGASAAPKRAIAVQNVVGLFKANQVAATTQDMWIQSPKASSGNPAGQRTLTFEDNWFFGRLQLYLGAASNLSADVVIRNNHFIKPGSDFSPAGQPSDISSALGNGSEAHSLRLMSPQNVATIIQGNEFKGFGRTPCGLFGCAFTPGGHYRALWVMNRGDVRILDNVFTPNPGESDFTAVLIGNRAVWNGTSAPAAFGVTLLRNTFHANGATADNKAKAILFVDDNDPSGTAPGGTLQIGDGTQANANQFDDGIGWYVAHDDRSCTGNNHNDSSCNGSGSYVIGEGVAYSGGSNASTVKRPFKWDVSAAGNVFGGVYMGDMAPAQYDAVRAKTYDDHNKVQAAATVGNVVYGYTPPVITDGTIHVTPASVTYTGSPFVLSATLEEDPSATCTVDPASVTDAGVHAVEATCTSATYDVTAMVDVTVHKAAGTPQLQQSAFVYTGTDFVLVPTMAEDAAASCMADPASVRDAGSYAIHVTCAGANHVADGHIDVNVAKAVGTLAWGPLSFDYSGSTHTVSASVAEDGSTCDVDGATIGPAIGSYAVSAIACHAPNHDVAGLPAAATATIGGSTAVRRASDNAYFPDVATALADAGTVAGDTLELAPGTYGPITLTKGVHLKGSTAFVPNAVPGLMAAGPSAPPVTILDGGGTVPFGIVVANGVTGATISGFEVRNFTQNCVAANQGNHNLAIHDNVVHDCGLRGIFVNGAGTAGVHDVTIRNNHVSNTVDRAISLWNGPRRDISIIDNIIVNAGTTAISFDDGTAAGITITGNEITDSGDAGISALQLTGGSPSSTPNVIANNTITNPGRFGITLLIPNGSGGESGDGAIVVEQNLITGGANLGGFASDRAGISVVRRYYSGASQGQTDATRGVVIRDNTVSGFGTAVAGREAYGIVVEGQDSSILRNTLANNQIGLQIQQGNVNHPGDAPLDASTDDSDWFDRGNAPSTCVSVGDGADANAFSGSTLADQREIPAGTPMIGARVLNQDTGARYCSINAAIAAAVPGETLVVDPGVYVENVVVDRAITLLGAQAGVPATPSRSSAPADATIIVPPVAASGMGYAMNPSLAVMSIESDDVVVDGFVLDGDNPAIATGLPMGAADPDVDSGVFAKGSDIRFANNEVRNLVYAGFVGYNDTASEPARSGNVVAGNWIHNLDAPSAWGIGIVAMWNHYADIRDNMITDARIGVQTNYFFKTAPVPADARIADNQIEATVTGIYHNYHTADQTQASPFAITGNTVSANANPAAPANSVWAGIFIQSLYDASTATVTGNNVDGSALAGSGRLRLGYGIGIIPSSQASSLAVDGGSVTGVDYGVLATDGAYYAGRVDDYTIRNVAFSEVSIAAIAVEDTLPAGAETTDNAVRLTVGTGNTFAADVIQHGSLSGPNARIEFAPGAALLDRMLVQAGGLNYRNGLPDSNGNVRSVDPGTINDAIADAAVNGTVTLEAGTFPQNVVVNKALSLVGPHAGVHGNDPARGSGEAIVAPASGIGVLVSANDVTTDGLTIEVTSHSGLQSGARDNGKVLNTRFVDSTGNGIHVEHGTPSSNWMIRGNLFENLTGGTVTAVRLFRTDGVTVLDNVFRNIAYQAIQLSTTDGAEIRGNDIDLAQVDGINVAASSHVVIASNSIASVNAANDGDRGAVRLYADNTDLQVSCNSLDATRGGIVLRSGSGSDLRAFHNAISGARPVVSEWTAGAVIGSNWYGGGLPTVSGSQAGGVQIADPLPVDPFGNPDCGDNAPVAIVAYAGTSPQATEIGTAFADLRARVQDVLGGAVTGQPVTYAVPGSGASATLGTPAGNTDFNGELRTTATANLIAGSYNATAASGSLSSAVFALTNTMGTATITVTDATVTWDGNVHAVGVATTPAGLEGSVQVVYSQGATTVATCTATDTACGPANAGTYAVTATLVDPNYAGSGSGTLTILRAPTTIEFQPDPLTFVHDGSSHVVTARLAAEPSTNCPVTGTVGPNAGSYPVAAAACTGTNHEAPAATATATVTPQPVAITLSHLTQPHDGSPKSVLATTTPAGVALSITYDGAAAPPTAVGSYAVHAESADANYAGSADATLQIVPGNGDIALVLNGPVDAVHVDEPAQYAATMLANPALHAGETFGYRVVLSKSGGTHPLALSDIATMEVFYNGNWVDAIAMFGALPFTPDGSGGFVYDFPDGVPGYAAGFPILDSSWTWNFRFTFADTGTYTTSATLIDGTSKVQVTPAVTASIATVVVGVLPPTDIHLVLGGPAESVQVGMPAEYTGTLLADPAEHMGEDFFVKVRVAKSGGHPLVAGDLASMEIFQGGSWIALPPGAFAQPGGPGTDLVYFFPQPAMPGGFPIDEEEWTWNFRFSYADEGTYTATAEVIHAADAGNPSPTVFAADAISTTVVPMVVIPPTANLVLLGPVEDVEVGEAAGYTGTLVADPADFAGQTFWVRVRLSKNGGADAMTAADLAKMELHDGSSWNDATAAIAPLLVADGNDLVYWFPQPYPAFTIDQSVWTWHFRFTYANSGVYRAVADLVDAADASPLTAPSIAGAAIETTVVPQTPEITIALQGPVSGNAGQPLHYTGTLAADPLPDPASLYLVRVRLEKDGGAVPMTAADLEKTEISIDGIAWSDFTGMLPFTTDGNALVYDFPEPALPAGFPIDSPSWTWHFRFTYADAGTFAAEATVITADTQAAVSNTAQIQTVVGEEPDDVSLTLNGPISGVEVGEPAHYIGRLVNDGPDLDEDVFVKVRVEHGASPLAATDVTAEVWDGASWVAGTLTEVAGGLEADFPDALGFALPEGFDFTHQFRLTYHVTGLFSADASVVGVTTGDVYATAGMFTEVVPHAAVNVQVLIDPASLHAVYDSHPHAASASTVPAGHAVTFTYNGIATAPTDAGSYVVVATVNDPPFVGSASAVLTIDKAPGTIAFAPLSGPFGGPHAVTATLVEEPAAACTVAGVPASGAAPGPYTVVASCTGTNHVASATATYVVTGATAAIQPLGPAPVGVVTLDPLPDADAKKSAFAWQTTGSAAENVRAEFTIVPGSTALAGDIELEYFDTADSTWKPLPLAFSGNQWTGSFGPAAGFPLVDGATSQFRAAFHGGGRYTTTARLVGAGSGLVLATSAPLVTDVAELGLGGIANAAGQVGLPVETGLTLANTGTAALSSGLPAGNPIPVQPAPNDENVRGRFTITWDGGALVPADTSGPGGNCGSASCASPDVGIEYYDAVTGTYKPIHNLRLAGDGQSLYGHFGSLDSQGLPVPAAFSATNLFRTTFKRNTGTYSVRWEVVGITTGTVYAQAPVQTIGVDTGVGATIAIVAGDGGTATVGSHPYDQGDLVVEVRDLGGNPVAGATVAFNVLSGPGGAGATFVAPPVTDASGRTAIQALSNGVAGVFGIDAGLSNGVSLADPFALENVADRDPAQLAITIESGDGQTAQVGTAYALPLAAKVADRFGNPLSAVDVAFTASGAGAVLAQPSGSTDAGGLVDSGSVTAGATAGAVTVTATIDAAQCDDGSPDAACSVDFGLTNTAGGAASVTLASAATDAEVGSPAAYALTATVHDASGNPVPGVSVTLVGPGAGAGIAPALHAGITDAAGQVAHVFDANLVAGTFQVQAVVSGAAPAGVTLENRPGAPAKIVRVSGDGQSTPVDMPFAAPLVVRVLDAHDNPVADDAAAIVDFVAPSGGASATVAASVASVAGGYASTAATANDTAGTYTVVASFNGHDVGFVLTNAVGAVTVSDIVWAANGAASIAYDGNPQAASATVSGSSLAPTFTYNGSATPPIDAGSYHVIATVDDGNVHGSASAMLTITPAAAGASGIVLTGGTFTYDGSARPATVTNPGGVAYTLGYDTADGLAPIDAGSYVATLTVTDPNHAAETMTATIDIGKATGTVMFGSTNFTFDGTGHVTTAVIAQEPDDTAACVLTATGEYPRVAAGSTTVSVACDGTNHTASGSTTLVVSPKPVTIALSGLGSFPYDGLPHAATATVADTVAGFPVGALVTYDGMSAPPVAVGTYAVAAVLDTASPNAGNYSAAPATGTIVIGAANATIVLGDLAQVYDGTPRAVTVTTTPAGLAYSLTYDGGSAAPVDAGSYTVVATITDPGYSGSASATLVVAKALASVALSDLVQAWDGTPRPVTVTTTPAGLDTLVTYDGSTTPPSAVGSYAVTATVTDANHAGSVSGILQIVNGSAQAIAANGPTTFAGTAGEPLAGTLPSVRVTDAGGNPVAGVSVTFAAGAGDGTLTGAVQTTDGNGIATLGGWILDPLPGTDTVVATAAGVTGSVSFTATSTAAEGALSVAITDNREFGQFGEPLTYVITIGNDGASQLDGVAVSDVLPVELDAATATWQCIPVNGASCTGAGTGDLVDSVDLPPGGSAIYLLTATITRAGTDRVTNTVSATGPDGTVTATDQTDVAIFRDGFEAGGDGSGLGDAIGTLEQAGTVALPIDRTVGRAREIGVLAGADDGRFRVEAIRVGGEVWLRLIARGGAATAWSRAAGDFVVLALEQRTVLLEGTDEALALAVGASGPFRLLAAE